ncbi:MAG: endolytic transglycosylase MltG [Gammaproteobacteria bacterium]|nr:endolytic transglycosylase MltG [Gammaproteobacteria bacterium]
MFRNSLIRFLALLVVAAGVVLGGSWFYYVVAVSKPFEFGEGTFVVARGETLNGISRRLTDSGITPEPWSLRILARQNGNKPIMAGEYDFPRTMALTEFLDRIVSGRGQVDVGVTIVEGWTFRMMREVLGTAEGLRPDTREWSDDRIMEALGYPDLHPEGQFYPDTYYYRKGDPDLDIYRKAFELMQFRLRQVWAQRSPDLPLDDPYEALIVASIIEKETQDRDEQPTIAGVLFNRLRKGMRLQTDPTVIYGVGDAFDGNITRKHLKTDTPYNTYTRAGLTPTPISLPGMDSLMAAVRPAETEAYYFVAKGGGRHHFSRTLEEHNRAVRKYILGKKQ